MSRASASWISLRVEVAFCGEGLTNAAVARRLILSCGGVPGTDYISSTSRRGKDRLDARLRGLNVLGNAQPVLVLRDLDADAACPADLVSRLLPGRTAGLLLRVAVRSVEAWLMADKRRFAATMHLPLRAIPDQPEGLPRPKDALVSIICAHAGRALRRRLELEGGATRIQPQLLGAELSSFADEVWNPVDAASSGRAPSLARAVTRLRAALA